MSSLEILSHSCVMLWEMKKVLVVGGVGMGKGKTLDTGGEVGVSGVGSLTSDDSQDGMGLEGLS